MKNYLLIIVALSIFVSCKNEKEPMKEAITVNYPDTKKVDTVNTFFGESVADPYRWLEDDQSEETEAWVKAQNEATFGYLDNIPYREELRTAYKTLEL